jgi:ABC-type Fe3+ transport system substrate-binding protein
MVAVPKRISRAPQGAEKGERMLCRITGLRLSAALSALLILTVAPLAAARAESLDQLYEKAKKEGALVIYSGGGPAGTKAAAETFEKRFPGIAVTPMGGFSNVLDNDIDQQLKNKKVTADYVQLQTVADYARWDKAGALMHFKPEGFEQVLAPMKEKNGAWVAVNAIPLLYAYNAEKVQAADLPKSALDFLKPPFRGQLVTAYPADDDATLYDFELIAQKYGRDYLKKYLANGAYFVQGHRDVAARLKSGASALSFDVTNGSQGGSLKVVMSEKDKTPVFFTAAGIMKNAPHPNAAKLYVSWQLSKEVQGKNPVFYSPRRDVAPPPGMPPLTSAKFANGYRDFLGDGSRMAALRKRYEALTGPVINKSTVP